jgi:hypothetical protein
MRILLNAIIPEERLSFNSALANSTQCALEALHPNQLILVTPY